MIQTFIYLSEQIRHSLTHKERSEQHSTLSFSEGERTTSKSETCLAIEPQYSEEVWTPAPCFLSFFLKKIEQQIQSHTDINLLNIEQHCEGEYQSILKTNSANLSSKPRLPSVFNLLPDNNNNNTEPPPFSLSHNNPSLSLYHTATSTSGLERSQNNCPSDTELNKAHQTYLALLSLLPPHSFTHSHQLRFHFIYYLHTFHAVFNITSSGEVFLKALETPPYNLFNVFYLQNKNLFYKKLKQELQNFVEQYNTYNQEIEQKNQQIFGG